MSDPKDPRWTPGMYAHLELIPVEIRVPKQGELYIDRNNHVQRCKDFRFQSHAKIKLIVREEWT